MPMEDSCQRLDDERELQPRRHQDLAAAPEHGEFRHGDPVVRHQLLRQRLVARQQEPARVAPGVRHAQQLEIADDVLVEEVDVVERLEEVEDNRRLPLLHGEADRVELVLNAERLDLVPVLAQRRDDVELGLPLGVHHVDAGEVVGRHQVLVDEDEDALALHG